MESLTGLRVPRLGLRAFLLGAASCLIAACNAENEVYPVASEQARAGLEGTEILETAVGAGVRMTPARIVGKDILWYAEDERGARVLKLWARLEQEGQATRATIEVAPNSEQIERNLAARPELRQLFVAVARERVDATLKRRAFDDANVAPEIAATLAPMQPTLEAGFRVGEAADARVRAETIDRTYNEARRPPAGSYDWEDSEDDGANSGWGDGGSN